MMTVKEVKDWLSVMPDDSCVAVDEGGLTLVMVGNEGVYLEVGGVPEEDENDLEDEEDEEENEDEE